MAIKSISVTTNYRTLNDITNKLNGANRHKAHTLNGMFFRRQDFESSVRQLMQQLGNERMLALKFADKGYDGSDFEKAAKEDNVRTYMRTGGSSGESSFSTYDLSPALRHFVNDYCRVLEPIVKLLAEKTGVSAKNKRKPDEMVSFNSYLKKLDREHIKTPLDHEFFIKMYDEIWNDYKHAESSGIQASGWSSDGEAIKSEPKLLGNKLDYFKNMGVKDFVDKSLDNMNGLLDYID